MVKWAVLFLSACLGLLALVFGGIWAFEGFARMGLSLNGMIALAIGIVATSGLGFGLMALVFYSERSGVDEEVHSGTHLESDPEAPERSDRNADQR